MTVYVGIDGGGSKTRTVAIDAAGQLLLDHLGDGADLPARGADHVRRVLAEIRARLEEALGDRPTLRVAAGMPAMGETDVWDEELAALVADAFPAWPVTLHNDVRLALEGALPHRSGVLVLSGTGSMAWGKTADGREARTGGWGPLLGDQGSGYDMGRRALAAACMAEDGRGPATRLRAGVPAALGAADLRTTLALLSRLPQPPRAHVAGLVPTVLAAAEQGDAVATAIVERAATDLALHVEALLRRLDLPPDATVSYAGGCFRGAALRRAFDAALGCAGFPPARPPEAPPAFGGAVLAGLAPERLPADPRA